MTYEELIVDYRHHVERQHYWLNHPTHVVEVFGVILPPESHTNAVNHGLEARLIEEQMKTLRADWRSICSAIVREIWFGSPYP